VGSSDRFGNVTPPQSRQDKFTVCLAVLHRGMSGASLSISASESAGQPNGWSH
jgi:hypothetical protein